jgi:hypothetical protein
VVIEVMVVALSFEPGQHLCGRMGTGMEGEVTGILEVNARRIAALSNKPLQRLNACVVRSEAGCAATPRAGARGLLAAVVRSNATVGVHR